MEEAPSGWHEAVEKLMNLGLFEAMQVVHWTGPALFTDSVLA